MKAKCDNPKCLYEWECNSKMIKVTCPSCGKKVEFRKTMENNKDDKNKVKKNK